MGIPIPMRIVAMSKRLGQTLENSTIHAVRDGAYRRRPTIPLLNSVPFHLTHVVRLNPDPANGPPVEPKFKCLCSACKGYSSFNASMMVATSQSIVLWLLMGRRLAVSVGQNCIDVERSSHCRSYYPKRSHRKPHIAATLFF